MSWTRLILLLVRAFNPGTLPQLRRWNRPISILTRLMAWHSTSQPRTLEGPRVLFRQPKKLAERADGTGHRGGSGVTSGGGSGTHGHPSAANPTRSRRRSTARWRIYGLHVGQIVLLAKALRRPSMEIAERAQESIHGIQRTGDIRPAKPEINYRILRCYIKNSTATLLVPFHRIPPPKESMKMFRGESPLENEHSGSVKISYDSWVTVGQIVVTLCSNDRNACSNDRDQCVMA
jgi:hypothetical protein